MPSQAIRGTSARAMRSLCGARQASAIASSSQAIAERISDRCVGETPSSNRSRASGPLSANSAAASAVRA